MRRLYVDSTTTVYRGVMGYGANQRVHKGGFLKLSHDLPMMIAVVDSEEKTRRAIAALDEMVDEGLIVMSVVEVIKYTHNVQAGQDLDVSEHKTE
jgi:PII-like signaling protein